MKPHVAPPLLSEIAYERILQALFDARVPMGARVSQGWLVALAGVPVGPVRDALKVLEADGLVKVHPRAGIELIKPTTDLLRATIQFRLMIERPAARSFAIGVDPATLDDLIARHAALSAEFATLPPDQNVFDRLTEVEEVFHPALVASLGNELVDASYRRLRLMTRINRVSAKAYPLAACVSIAEHVEVLTACKRRDADAAEAAIGRHLTNALNRSLGMG